MHGKRIETMEKTIETMDQWNHGLKNMDVQQTMLWDAQTPAASEFQLWTRRLTSTLCKYFFQIQTLDLKRLCLTFISGLKPQLKFAPTFHTDNPLKITQLMAVRLSEKKQVWPLGEIEHAVRYHPIDPSQLPTCFKPKADISETIFLGCRKISRLKISTWC